MKTEDVVVAALLAVAASEMTECLGWAAAKIGAFSARLRYGDTERGRIRAEELARMIKEERPGQTLKLATALWLLSTGVYFATRRRVKTVSRTSDSSLSLMAIVASLAITNVAGLGLAFSNFQQLSLPYRATIFAASLSGAGALRTAYRGFIRPQKDRRPKRHYRL